MENQKSCNTVILYSNDVHCAAEGFAKLAAYRCQMEEAGHDVILADAGDAIQGEAIGALTKGKAIVQIMNAVGYDAAVPGNHEFDYGLDVFLQLAEYEAEFPYLSANFTDLKNNSRIFAPYRIMTGGSRKIALIGICTPETYTKSTPGYFKDCDGAYRYTFCEEKLYDVVQQAVNDVREAGAQTVVVLGHLGIEGITEGWRSVDVIANTAGIDVFIDGHSHQRIPFIRQRNKEDRDVLLTSAGENLDHFGKIIIRHDGSAVSELICAESVDPAESKQALAAYNAVKRITERYLKVTSGLDEVAGFSEVSLVAYDICTGDRVVRNCETNLGDFVADAYRACSCADVALVNGGRIRASIRAGIVTRRHMSEVNPWNNEMCVIRISGQQVLDALEHGARMNPGECGGFLQSSGLTYEIDLQIRESPVVTDEKDMFLYVDSRKSRRVKNVRINGRKIEPDKMYTVVGSCYMLLDAGDGFTMFAGAKVLQREELPSDTEMLVSYLKRNLRGSIPKDRYQNIFGSGRIIFRGRESGYEMQAARGTAAAYYG